MSQETKLRIDRLQVLCGIALNEGNMKLYRLYREQIVQTLGI